MLVDDTRQAGAQLVEYANDRTAHAAELAQHFNQRWATDVRNIGERYAKGYIEVHVGVRLPAGNRVAILKRTVPKRDELNAAHACGRSGSTLNPGDVQSSVFVLKVEVMEGVEWDVPSTIRFKREDSVPIGLGKTPYLPPHAAVSQSVFRLRERKCRVGWFDVSVPRCERVDQSIKRTSLRVKDRACVDHDGLGNGLYFLEEIDDTPPLGIRLFAKSVGLSFEKCPKVALEDVYLRIRPLDFCFGVV